jgi:transcriptional regulator with XRE-family HTH domain
MQRINLDHNIIGQRIRNAREQANLQQIELAEQLSVNQRAVSDMENGRRKVSALELATISSITNIPVLYFFEGEKTLTSFDYLALNQLNRLESDIDRNNAVELLRFFCDALEQHK